MTQSEQYHEYLSALSKLQRFNGCVLVAQAGQVCFEQAYGYADFETQQTLSPETVFRIGSLSKQFTAFALLTLVQTQSLDLQTPIQRWLPDYPESASISLQDLLSHRAGLAADSLERPEHTSLEALISANQSQPLLSSPGTEYHYSNLGYMLLARLIELISGQSFADYLNDTIFRPLKMTATAHGTNGIRAERLARGYRLQQGQPQLDDKQDASLLYGAGSLASTLGDLFRWAEALSGRSDYQPDLFKQMIQAPENSRYHLGLECLPFMHRPLLSHLGMIHSFRACFLRYPDQDLTIIVLSNLQPLPLLEIKSILSAIAFGEPYQLPRAIQRHSITMTSAQLAEYTGRYQVEHDPAQTLSITLDSEQLFQDDGASRSPLYPEQTDCFFVAADTSETLTFIRAQDQTISGICYLTADGWDARLRKLDGPP